MSRPLTREDLCRVRVITRGHASSVSMDGVLYGYLARSLGGPEATRQWVQAIVTRVDRLEERDILAQPRDVHASLSRLVQRAALRLLYSEMVGIPATPSSNARLTA